jgi:hypothetical protein
MATITPINRAPKLPIINGFVVVPDNPIDKRIRTSDALAAISGSSISLRPFITDSEQDLFLLPEFERDNQFPEDYYQILRDASSNA